ncbi:DeoR/GlpR family DNA-binding transcription regulator [Spiroplasma endosymbiont of Labia minor]|uniref:DeoR/GlpR family DNA-binding transcription regulator n=1 Tax=Spiroplasma endosymbiont of Labia minor TaxID=3066305 RepID=UPI0030CB39BB
MKDKRRTEILQIVNKKGFVKSIDLARQFKTTIQTIINDINSLEIDNLVVKVYGGVKSKKIINNELTNEEKMTINVEAKKTIAKLAANKIVDGDLIFIDTGTTTLKLCQYLIDKDVTIVTNGYLIARELIEMGKNFIILGGEIRPGTGAIIGSISIEMLEKFKFDKSFIGINAYDSEKIYTTNLDEAIFKQHVINNSKKNYVLADSSKKDNVSYVVIDKLTKVEIISEN